MLIPLAIAIRVAVFHRCQRCTSDARRYVVSPSPSLFALSLSSLQLLPSLFLVTHSHFISTYDVVFILSFSFSHSLLLSSSSLLMPISCLLSFLSAPSLIVARNSTCGQLKKHLQQPQAARPIHIYIKMSDVELLSRTTLLR